MQELSVQSTLNISNVEDISIQYGAESACSSVIDVSYPPSISIQYGAESACSSVVDVSYQPSVVVQYGSEMFIVSEFEVPVGRRVFGEEPSAEGCDLNVSGSVGYGVVIDCLLGSLGDLRLPASAIEGFEYQDVISSGFVPDTYAVRYLAQEAGLSRPRTVDSLVALRNLLEMCKSLDVGTVHAFCLKFRLVKDRRGRRFWVIEFT